MELWQHKVEWDKEEYLSERKDKRNSALRFWKLLTKVIGLTLLSLVLLGGVGSLIAMERDSSRAEESSKVVWSGLAGLCSKEDPSYCIKITATNNSANVLREATFSVHAYAPGHSNDSLDSVWHYKSWDLIVKPGESKSLLFYAPYLSDSKIHVESNSISFYQSESQIP